MELFNIEGFNGRREPIYKTFCSVGIAHRNIKTNNYVEDRPTEQSSTQKQKQKIKKR